MDARLRITGSGWRRGALDIWRKVLTARMKAVAGLPNWFHRLTQAQADIHHGDRSLLPALDAGGATEPWGGPSVEECRRSGRRLIRGLLMFLLAT